MSVRQSLGQMTRRMFLKASGMAATAVAVLSGSTEEGCGAPDPCAGYGYGYGYHYGYGRYGYGCYPDTLTSQSDLVVDRVADYLASLSRGRWPAGKGSRIKVRIS